MAKGGKEADRERGNEGELLFAVMPSETSVLVVDDEEMMRELVAERLRLEGYSVEQAGNGEDALEMLAVNDYDLLITDINMPVMNGLKLLRRIKGKFDIAILVMSGQGDLETAIYSMKLGASDYIIKPINFRVLTHTIESAIKNRRMEKALNEYQNNLESKVMEQTKIISELYLRSVQSLVKALEAKDVYTRGHSERVTHYSIELSKRVSFDLDIERIRIAGILHDLGKIGIPESVLNKPGMLDDKEFEMVKKHPILGVKILEPIEFLKPVFPVVLHHHEKFNGTGYPSGLSGDAIPLESRILAIADTFDAMTSTRAYRKALSKGEAIAEIERCSGTQFDPHMAKLFIEILPEITLPEHVWLPEGITEEVDEKRESKV